MEITVLVLFLLSGIIQSEAARVLAVYPTPSISHQVVFRPLTQELAKRGHQVTVITPDPAFPLGQSPPNLTEIDVHDISYRAWENELIKIAVGTNNDMNAQVIMFIELFYKILEQQLLSDKVRDIVMNKELQFDIILVEACVRSALIFSHIFKAPVIQMSSFGAMLGMSSYLGSPTHPLLYPVIVRQRLFNLTKWEKVREVYYQLSFERIYDNYESVEDEMLKRVFGPDVPSLNELKNNVDLIFLNTNTFWNHNHPMPPNVIYMGGVHQKPERELPKDLKSYMDASKHGVIYMSFGTNVQPSILPPDKIQMMIKVFSKLPYDVIWKWDRDLPGKSDNIKIFDWLPQSDLLRHPKLKLFITQGGLQSTDEAITAGVPLIGIPFIADQWYNVEKYVYHRIGLQLDIGTFTEKQFMDAITTVIKNESYRNNIVRMRTLINDQPQSPLERAVWWTEYVLRHGGAKHLRTPAFNMSWAEYLELELVLILLAISVVALILLCVAVYYVQRFVFTYVLPSVKLKMS